VIVPPPNEDRPHELVGEALAVEHIQELNYQTFRDKVRQARIEEFESFYLVLLYEIKLFSYAGLDVETIVKSKG
jgi:hypothetical protein